jgi:hypothetical protein
MRKAGREQLTQRELRQEHENHGHRGQCVRAGQRKAKPNVGHHMFHPPVQSALLEPIPNSYGASAGIVPFTSVQTGLRCRVLLDEGCSQGWNGSAGEQRLPMNKRELRVGQRVAREGYPRRLGTVIEMGQRGIKVKWDSGRTSYYRADPQGNVPLNEPRQW